VRQETFEKVLEMAMWLKRFEKVFDRCVGRNRTIRDLMDHLRESFIFECPLGTFHLMDSLRKVSIFESILGILHFLMK
jgi:hypothetical protein